MPLSGTKTDKLKNIRLHDRKNIMSSNNIIKNSSLLCSSKIGIIGAGTMGKAIASGLLKNKFITSSRFLSFCEPNKKIQTELFTKFQGAKVSGIYSDITKDSEIIFLCIKPQIFKNVLKDIKPHLKSNQILISIMAGVPLNSLERLLPESAVIRAMPNAPAIVNKTACGYTFGSKVSQSQKELSSKLLKALGVAYEFTEEQINAVTGLSASSPAFVFMMIEAMADAGVREGIPRRASIELAAQAVLGAAIMVLDLKEHPGQLKDKITTPSGTTIEGVRILEKAGFRGIVMEGIIASVNKSRIMVSKQYKS